MDAIEDLDDDKNEGTYNPFIAANPDFTNKKEFVKNNIFPIGEIMGGIIGRIQAAYASLRDDLKFNENILDNIIYQGLSFSAHRIIRGDKLMDMSITKMITGRMNRGVPPTMV